MSEQNCTKISTLPKRVNILKDVKFIIISYMVSLILILALTALIIYTDLPESVGNIGVSVITFFGSFFSAFLCGRSQKRCGMFRGIINGGMNIGGLLLAGMAIYGISPSVQTMVIKLTGGCLSGAFGGILGVNTAKE